MTSAERKILATPRFDVVSREYRTPNGSQAEREVVLHPGAVAILPLFSDGRVLLIENYRVAVEQTLIEVPAGTLEPGEAPETTALRELEEETGYRAGHIEPLAQLWMSPGILRERMHIFLATDLTPGRRELQPGEIITPRIVPWNEALKMVSRGEIEDAKSVAAILLYETLRSAQLDRAAQIPAG